MSDEQTPEPDTEPTDEDRARWKELGDRAKAAGKKYDLEQAEKLKPAVDFMNRMRDRS